jgi:hypothetical protein
MGSREPRYRAWTELGTWYIPSKQRYRADRDTGLFEMIRESEKEGEREKKETGRPW